MYFVIVYRTKGMCLTLKPSIKYIALRVAIWINAAYSNLECWDLSNFVCPTIDSVSMPRIYELRICFRWIYKSFVF